MPALQVSFSDPIFTGGLWGFILALPTANGVTTFFGSLLLCSALGAMGCIFTDRGVMRRGVRAYRDLGTRT